MSSLAFRNVTKTYPDGTRAVANLTLDVSDGECVVFVGPSGCGKSTALRMVAGLEDITDGEVAIGERVVNTVDPRKRDVAMVFQNYALYPHMSVFENIAFPLRSRGVARREINVRVKQTAELLGLETMLMRRPRVLSGGQRQRVAMGRAIVRQPKVFLMDEPLSNLDAKLRVRMRFEIMKLQRELGVTTIYVTHDQVEALTMGERIAVMRRGVLQQYGVPQEVYDRPQNLFVATFIGSPPMNLFQARLERDRAGVWCNLGERHQPLRIVDQRSGASELSQYIGRQIAVGIRPEHLVPDRLAAPDDPRVTGKVILVEALGSERLVHVDIDAAPVLTEEVLEVAQDVDAGEAQVLLEAAQRNRVQMVARLDSDAPLDDADEMPFAIRRDRLHFFDLESGLAIR